ncbi:MAG: hypothetical protein GY853_13240 [PVC group bacterium]|nr:hypothetical protein [PVC group bacterium]
MRADKAVACINCEWCVNKDHGPWLCKSDKTNITNLLTGEKRCDLIRGKSGYCKGYSPKKGL